MSIATLKMPRLGETMEQGEIVGWLVEVGQKFERGQAILEVETDKTVVEYPALGAGLLCEVLADEGDRVTVGDAIAKIDLGKGPDWTQEKTESAPAQTKATPKPNIPQSDETPTAASNRPRATPVARRIARNAGIDLIDVKGTGRRGRIESYDVETALSKGKGGDVRYRHGIAYVATGPRSGPQFLLLHGFAGDHTGFSVLFNGLVRAGARVASIDLPGHGATELEAPQPDDLSQNLTEITNTLFDQKPYHLVAHSMGAIPAVALAESKTPASVSLIAPLGVGTDENSDFLNGMANPTSIEQLRELLNLLTEKPNGLSETAVEAVYQELLKGRLISLARTLSEQCPDILPAIDRLVDIVPVRVLVGENDRIMQGISKTKLPPEVAVHRFAGTAHMPHWESPHAVLRILLAAGTLLSST